MVIFVAYVDRVKGYKLWSLSLLKFLVSRYVTFGESTILDLYKVSMSYLNMRITSRGSLPNIFIKETQVDESKDAHLEKLYVNERSQLQR